MRLGSPLCAALLVTAGLIACSDETGVSSDLPKDAPEVTTPQAILLNEVVAKATANGPDWVELYNPGTSPADLSGFRLEDSLDTRSFTFPAGTTIPSGGFLVIEGEGGSGTLVTTFGFGSDDAARLFDAAGAPVDSTSWTKGQALEGTSWGRSPDGSGAFATLAVPTKGLPNATPL